MLAIVAVAAALAASGAAAESQTASAVTVHLADGAQVPLVDWILSYEFLSGQAGAMPSESMRRDTHELRIGGRSWPTRGTRIVLDYDMVDRERDGEDGQVVKEKVPRVSTVTVTREGKTSKLRPTAPDRKFLVGDEKKLNILPRTLELRGETLTGTKREVCLMSFSQLAGCGETEDSRVVKVEFQ